MVVTLVENKILKERLKKKKRKKRIPIIFHDFQNVTTDKKSKVSSDPHAFDLSFLNFIADTVN